MPEYISVNLTLVLKVKTNIKLNIINLEGEEMIQGNE
jgi:hypothetical protein